MNVTGGEEASDTYVSSDRGEAQKEKPKGRQVRLSRPKFS